MKKLNLLLSVFALFCSGACIAQTIGTPFQTFDRPFIRYSENGKWMANSMQGIVSVMNAETHDVKDYDGGDLTIYHMNSINNQGIGGGWMIQGEGFQHAVYWTPDKEWADLPLRATDKLSSECYGASEDGSVLVGNVKRYAGGTGFESDISEVPVIWYRNSSGGYDVYEELPHAQKDFGGWAPQTMFIKGISTDGNTIVGRFYDYSGFHPFPVVWKRSDDGKWNYKEVGKDFAINKGEKVPQYPRHLPVEPDIYNYLSASEAEKYEAAIKTYEDSVSLADWTLPEEQRKPYPNYNPEENKADFFDISTTEGAKRHNQYAEEYNKFRNEAIAYNDSLMEFYDDCDRYFKLDSAFYMIDLEISPNGRYAVTNINITSAYTTYGVLIDLETEKVTVIKGAEGYIPACALNDGTVFLFNPVGMPPLYRHTIVWKEGSDIIPFTEWLKAISPKALEDLESTCEYVGDVLYEGLVCTRDGEGKVLGSFNQDMNGIYSSWLMDLTAYDDSKFATEINTTENTDMAIYPNPATENIYVQGDGIEHISMFDLTGRQVYQSSSAIEKVSVSNLTKGTYLLKITINGKEVTHKVMVTK